MGKQEGSQIPEPDGRYMTGTETIWQVHFDYPWHEAFLQLSYNASSKVKCSAVQTGEELNHHHPGPARHQITYGALEDMVQLREAGTKKQIRWNLAARQDRPDNGTRGEAAAVAAAG